MAPGSSFACPNLFSGVIASDYDHLYNVMLLIKIYVHSTPCVAESRIMPTGSNFFRITKTHVSIIFEQRCLVLLRVLCLLLMLA